MTAVATLPASGLLNGVTVERTSLDRAVEVFIEGLVSGVPPQAHRLVNSYTFALADIDPTYLSLLGGAGVNLPDGKPLVAALNQLDEVGPAFGQVRGPSFFVQCLDEGRARGVRHLLLGGSDELLESLKHAIERRFPGTQIVGMISPPFRLLTNAERVSQDLQIKARGADVVWVGLGTPKQDFEAQRICDECDVTTAAVGAAFDFVAGMKQEAPDWMRKHSLEWVFRLLSEPRRLWKRYLFGNTRFVFVVVREKLERR